MNFFKSSLKVVNVDSIFLEFARDFFHCVTDFLPFKYLGLLVEANPRLETTWDPLVNLLGKRLNY